MIKFNLLLIVLMLSISLSCSVYAEDTYDVVEVLKIIDGDTIDIRVSVG